MTMAKKLINFNTILNVLYRGAIIDIEIVVFFKERNVEFHKKLFDFKTCKYFKILFSSPVIFL